MILGFNEYFNELLLEAKSPEEVVRILSYKYPEMPESLVKELVDIDPTKKKSYAGWVLNVEKDPRKINSYIKTGKLAKIFDYFRENAKEGASLVDKASLEEAAGYLPEFSDIFSYDNENPKANDYEIVFESPEWIVATPKSYAASKKLGKNTKWCTADAYGNGLHYYNDYTGSGPLWINFDKRQKETLGGVTYPFKRYQFCFERKAFLDAKDQPFDWEDLDMPENVQEMYKEKGYDLSDLMMSDEERWENYTQERYDDSVWVFDDLYLMQEWDNDLRFENIENADYMLYNIEYDETDAISNSATYKKDSVIFSDDSLKLAILKEVNYGRTNDDTYTIAIEQTETNRRGTDINLYSEIHNFKLFDNGRRYAAYIDGNGSLNYVAYEGTFVVPEEEDPRELSDSADIFINKALSNDDAILYIEVSDSGVHSLYKVDFVDFRLIEVVKYDIPVNNEFFELDKDGKIEGKYGTYSPDGENDDEEEPAYAPVKSLENRDLVLCKSQYRMYNVFSTGNMQERLFDNDFDALVADLTDSHYNGIIVQAGDNDNSRKKYLLSIAERKPVAGPYDYMQASGNKEIIIAANGVISNGEMVPAEDRYIITGKGDVKVSSAYPCCINGRTPVYIKDETGHSLFRVLNMDTLKFEAEWATVAERMAYVSFASNAPIAKYVLTKDTSENIHLYDWTKNKIVSSGLTNKRRPRNPMTERGETCSNTLYVLYYSDGTLNVFNPVTAQMSFDNRPKSIMFSLSSDRNNMFAMLSFDDGSKNYFVEFSPDGNVKKLLNGQPVLSSGHELYPHMTSNFVTFTVDNERGKIFKLDLLNGQISCFGLNPETGSYDEMPVEKAQDDIKQLAAQIFPWATSKAQSLMERMNKIAKRK